MKYTVVGDPHATHKNLDKMKILTDMVEAQGLPAIWLGDMLDTKEVVRGKCLNFWIDYFKNSELQHFVLVGNHDFFNLECKDHSLQALKTLGNVIVVDAPAVTEHFVALPYIHDKEILKSSLQGAKRWKRPVIGHLELVNFDFGNGFICKEGLGAEELKDFPLVISGHFHKHQVKNNICYVGTPFTHSFGESNQKKHIAIIDFGSKEIEYIPTNLPAHVSLDIEATKVNKKLIDKINESAKKNYVRVVIAGSKEDILNIDIDLFDKSIKIIKKYTDEIDYSELEVKETLSNDAQFKFWAENIKKIDDATINLGIKYLQESK